MRVWLWLLISVFIHLTVVGPCGRTLRSALSTELAQQTRERIEKGAEKASPPVFQPSAVAPPAAPTQRDDHFDSQSRATTEADQPNSSSAVLFSSDSEKEVEVSTPARIKSVAQPADDSTPVTHEKKPQADGQVAPEKKTENPATFSQAPSSPLLLPIPRKSLSEVPETKRPRPRSNPLPDLSFLPPVVQEICKRLARQIPRSAIVDQADYDKFVRQYETHRSEWELLDKVRVRLSAAVLQLLELVTHMQCYINWPLRPTPLKSSRPASGKRCVDI